MTFLFDVNLLMALLCSAQTMRVRSPQSKQVSRFAAGSQSPVKGRPKIAYGFNRGSRVEKGYREAKSCNLFCVACQKLY